jgi:adenylosuccinate lyase
MAYNGPSFQEAVDILVACAHPKKGKKRVLYMPGVPRYQPPQLKPYLGYDQNVAWQILVAWFWMVALVKTRVMPESASKLLTSDLLRTLLFKITTTKVDKEEEKTKHDILALLELMRRTMPEELHRYLHLGLTSYDLISTAYSIQYRETYKRVFYPQACEIDRLWRGHISTHAQTLQIGRTHLQDALPVTVGFLLTTTHSRFANSMRYITDFSCELPGKFSGGVGVSAAILSLLGGRDLEKVALNLLGLPPTQVNTQIVQHEFVERFLHGIMQVSGTMAQLGENVRKLQATAYGEFTSASSTSSTISHKIANPIAGENLAGMHRSVVGDYLKVILNSQSDLGRDLRDSSVMRGYSSIIVYTFQQLLTTKRILKSLKVDEKKCLENFWVNGKLVTAELLHLSLQLAGYPKAHTFVNKIIVPLAKQSGNDLVTEMEIFLRRSRSKKLREAWAQVTDDIRQIIQNPNLYIGDAAKDAMKEANNSLEAI